MNDVSPWIGRLAAFVLLLGLLALLVLYGVLPIRERYVNARESDAHNREVISRLAGAPMRMELLRKRSEVVAGQLEASGLLLAGNNDALASAELREHLKRVIEDKGGQLQSSQSLPPKEEGGFQRVTLRVTMTASIWELLQVLHALEGQQPYLFVDTLDIKSSARRRRRSRDPEVESPTLTTRFDLVGYILPQEVVPNGESQ